MTDPASVQAERDVAAFVAKWRGAWPEWGVVEGFVPAEQRDTGAAWQALQFEWQEAAWGGADPRPGEAKLAWWGEELAGWAQGRRRHPLGAVLSRSAAPWQALAQELPRLGALRAPPSDAEAAWHQLGPLADAVAAAESALLGGRAEADAVTAVWLHARLARHPASALPGDMANAAAWAQRLIQRWPSAHGLSATRRLELALARARLARGDAATPRGPWPALWAGWRAVRA